MKYLIVSLFLLSFIMIASIFGIVLQKAFADYTETVNLRFNDNPNVCIFEPENDREYFNNNTLKYVISGIKEWESILNKSTEGDWYIPINIYKWEEHAYKKVHDFLDCQIIISFERKNIGTIVNSNATGFTYFDHSWSKHKYAHITIFTEAFKTNKVINLGNLNGEDTVTITIKPEKIPNGDIHHIAKHEFGHAVGLLHHFNTDGSQGKRSVMDASYDHFTHYYLQIQPRDAYAMIHLYGEDGWNVPNPLKISKVLETRDWFIPLIDIIDVRVTLI